MSIAVCAIIEPSRLLRVALAVYGMASAGAAMALASGQFGRFCFPWLGAAACLAGALVAGRTALARVNARVIDISGLGEIRLSVKQSLGDGAAQGSVVQLLPGSTVWPSLLLLLLRDADNGAITVLTILPDSAAPEQFRKIAVSVRAIARRDNKFFGKHKIL